MSPFTTQCSKCKTKFNINNPDMLGKKTKCKKCGTPMLLKPMESDTEEEGSLTDEIRSLQPIASRRQSHISKKMTAVEKSEGGKKAKKPKAVKQKADKSALIISLITTVVILFFAAGFLSLYYFSAGSSVEQEPASEQEPTSTEASP